MAWALVAVGESCCLVVGSGVAMDGHAKVPAERAGAARDGEGQVRVPERFSRVSLEVAVSGQVIHRAGVLIG